jgi:hypothetical protein
MPIPAWSYSRLTTFEQCKLWAKLAYLDKIPEPPRPLPPGKTEHANERGTRVHEAAELYISQNVELIEELEKFRPEFEHLKTKFKEGVVGLETEWAFTKDWTPTSWRSQDCWVRIKPDALVFDEDGTKAVLIDFKTGRKNGNEIKHMEQCQLYQLAAFLRNPELEEITCELWYLDQDEITSQTYSRKQGLRYLKYFNERGIKFTTEESFPANPNVYSCRWCPFGPKGTGHCKVGVQR